MKKSEQAESSEGEAGVDMISKLPDDVLRLILSGVISTEEITRTSILSRRWRYLWTSVPSIDLDCTRGLVPHKAFDSNGFNDFVNWVLLNKPIDLDSFRLRCGNYYNMSTIRRWIHAAVVRKVKLIDLMFCPPKEESEEVIKLPHCLVTCGSLEVLRLCLMGFRLCLPKVTGFSGLRVLELNDVLLQKAEVVKYFLESCPLLEDLTLLHCDAYDLVISSPNLKNLRIERRESIYDEEAEDYGIDHKMSSKIEISCPKLVFLNLTGSISYDFLFENLNSLKKAVIDFKHLFDYERPTFNLFNGISHVESLSISTYCVGQCYYRWLDDEPICLPNLKTLELTVDDMYIVIPFLKCIPDLESLHLIFIKEIRRVDRLDLEEAETISILTRHLKKVEILGFDEEEPKLDVAYALLEYGKLLEEMVFSWGNEARFHKRSMKIMKRFSKSHKASSTVKLTAVIKPSQANP